MFKCMETGFKRGSTFFQSNGYSTRIPNIEETGIKFIRLCSEIIFVGPKIKKSRALLGEELFQDSDYVKYFNEFQLKNKANCTVSSF